MKPDPHLFVVLGATGDLTLRKLLPALYRLVAPDAGSCFILGAATSDLDDAAYRRRAADALSAAGADPAEAASWVADHVFYAQLPPGGDYRGLALRIEALERRLNLPANRVLYLAIPPGIVPDAIEALGAVGLDRGEGWTRLVVEKPFGRDLASAAELNRVVHAQFAEEQVYRIDHYLGKETVRNLLVFRFSNPVFEASWNRDRIERVEITVAESVGVGTRGRYYDAAGAVRDMLQSHLTQVLTLVAMESPTALRPDEIRNEKVKVLRSTRPIEPDAVVVGQYDGGPADGQPVPDYRSLPGVSPESTTPTFAAVRLWIDNWRWQGVPFYLRTGKAMARRVTQVAVTFRRPPVCLFHHEPDECTHSDVLHLTLQPDEGFSLSIDVKEPGDDVGLRKIPLRFSYSEAFGELPDAYETLLADVLEGDQTLFVRADEVEESWRLYTPVIGFDLPLHRYPAGSWGPEAAARLLRPGSERWATGE